MVNEQEGIRWRVVNSDWHNHLQTGSDMSRINFNTAARLTRKKLGKYGMLGIVNCGDHRYEEFVNLPGYERINIGNAVYVPEQEIWIIKGQEIMTRHGCFLVFGALEGFDLRSGRTLIDTWEEAKDNELVTVIPHPAGILGCLKRLESMAKKINLPLLVKDHVDGFEIYNSESALWIPGIIPYHANSQAKEFFYDYIERWNVGLGAVAFSDGHSLNSIGTSYTTMFFPNPEHITNSEIMRKYQKEAIRSNKKVKNFQGRRQPARIEAIEHTVALAYYILRDKFLRER